LKPDKMFQRYFGTSNKQSPAKGVDALMTKAEIKTARQLAWWHIAHVFAGVRIAPGREATPGYVLGVKNSLDGLAQHIVDGMSVQDRGEIYASDRLPENYKVYIKGAPTEAAERVIREMVVRELTDLHSRHAIHFMEEGEWRIVPSELAEYHRFVRWTIPNPTGRGNYRRGSARPRYSRRVSRAVRDGLLATA